MYEMMIDEIGFLSLHHGSLRKTGAKIIKINNIHKRYRILFYRMREKCDKNAKKLAYMKKKQYFCTLNWCNVRICVHVWCVRKARKNGDSEAPTYGMDTAPTLLDSSVGE